MGVKPLQVVVVLAFCFQPYSSSALKTSSQSAGERSEASFQVSWADVGVRTVGLLWHAGAGSGDSSHKKIEHRMFEVAVFRVFFDRPVILWNATEQAANANSSFQTESSTGTDTTSAQSWIAANQAGSNLISGHGNFYCGGRRVQSGSTLDARRATEFAFPVTDQFSNTAFGGAGGTGWGGGVCNEIVFAGESPSRPVTEPIPVTPGIQRTRRQQHSYHHRTGDCLMHNLHDMVATEEISRECLQRPNCMVWGLILREHHSRHQAAASSSNYYRNDVTSCSLEITSNVAPFPKTGPGLPKLSEQWVLGDTAGQQLNIFVNAFNDSDLASKESFKAPFTETRHADDLVHQDPLGTLQKLQLLKSHVSVRLGASAAHAANESTVRALQRIRRLELLDAARGKVVVLSSDDDALRDDTNPENTSTPEPPDVQEKRRVPIFGDGVDMVNMVAFAEVLSDVSTREAVTATQYFELIEDPLMNLVVPVLINIVISIIKAPILQAICMVISSAIGAVLGPILPLVFLEEDESQQLTNTTSRWPEADLELPPWMDMLRNRSLARLSHAPTNSSKTSRRKNSSTGFQSKSLLSPDQMHSGQSHSLGNASLSSPSLLKGNRSQMLSTLVRQALRELRLTPSALASQFRAVGERRDKDVIAAIDARLAHETTEANRLLKSANKYAAARRARNDKNNTQTGPDASEKTARGQNDDSIPSSEGFLGTLDVLSHDHIPRSPALAVSRPAHADAHQGLSHSDKDYVQRATRHTLEDAPRHARFQEANAFASDSTVPRFPATGDFLDTCSRQTSFQSCLAVGPTLPGTFPVCVLMP